MNLYFLSLISFLPLLATARGLEEQDVYSDIRRKMNNRQGPILEDFNPTLALLLALDPQLSKQSFAEPAITRTKSIRENLHEVSRNYLLSDEIAKAIGKLLIGRILGKHNIYSNEHVCEPEKKTEKDQHKFEELIQILSQVHHSKTSKTSREAGLEKSPNKRVHPCTTDLSKHHNGDIRMRSTDTSAPSIVYKPYVKYAKCKNCKKPVDDNYSNEDKQQEIGTRNYDSSERTFLPLLLNKNSDSLLQLKPENHKSRNIYTIKLNLAKTIEKELEKLHDLDCECKQKNNMDSLSDDQRSYEDEYNDFLNDESLFQTYNSDQTKREIPSIGINNESFEIKTENDENSKQISSTFTSTLKLGSGKTRRKHHIESQARPQTRRRSIRSNKIFLHFPNH